MTTHTNASIATVRAGGRSYPLRSVANCRVCCSLHRLHIERELVSGRPPSAVLADLPGETTLTPRNLRDHVRNGHLPVEAEGVQRLVAEQAAERAEVAGQAAAQVVDALGFAQRVLGQVSARLLSGAVAPSLGDGLRAAALLARWEQDQPAAGMINEDDVRSILHVYLDAASRVLNPDQRAAYASAIEDSPVLAEMDRRYATATPARSGSWSAR